jgi:hypothetical protein
MAGRRLTGRQGIDSPITLGRQFEKILIKGGGEYVVESQNLRSWTKESPKSSQTLSSARR